MTTPTNQTVDGPAVEQPTEVGGNTALSDTNVPSNVTRADSAAQDRDMSESDLFYRQRLMHRTSGVDALCYQYGWNRDIAEARYDADTLAFQETGTLPDLPPSPDVSGPVATDVPVEPESLSQRPVVPTETPVAPAVNNPVDTPPQSQIDQPAPEAPVVPVAAGQSQIDQPVSPDSALTVDSHQPLEGQPVDAHTPGSTDVPADVTPAGHTEVTAGTQTEPQNDPKEF